MLNSIVSAIRSRHVLTFTYEGVQRTVEPHAVGISKIDGNDVMRCYQTGGENTHQGEEWLLCELVKIKNLADTGTSFSGPRPGYKKGDNDMKRAYIYAEL